MLRVSNPTEKTQSKLVTLKFVDEEQGLYIDGRALFKMTAVLWPTLQQGPHWDSSVAVDGH